MTGVRIGGREVGPGQPVYVIAEAGSNHNGSLERARQLVEIAARAGADAVKFQVFRAESLYSRFTPEFSYLKGEKVYDLIHSIETPREWIPRLARDCSEKGIQFLASPFDTEAIDLLEPHVPAYKIASFEITDLDFLEYAAAKGKPMILSTGMADLGEIEEAVTAIRGSGNREIVLLHCNSLYPTPAGIVNLNAMRTLQLVFRVPVGFSDHTTGIHIAHAAVAMGANVLEKHFTVSRALKGPDHGFAIEPPELGAMVAGIREIEIARGSGIKEKSTCESEEMYEKARRSLHAFVDIPAGTVITGEMLTVKRPGFGIPPKQRSLVIGRKAARPIRRDEWITWDMV